MTTPATTTPDSRPMATILPFPLRHRPTDRFRADVLAAEAAPVYEAAAAGWYHEAAIRDAERGRTV